MAITRYTAYVQTHLRSLGITTMVSDLTGPMLEGSAHFFSCVSKRGPRISTWLLLMISNGKRKKNDD